MHTSESERISTLAREALEEMRLSVRGLTGKPVRLADALADWRAETVSRLGQANIEIDWRSLAEDTDQVLPARSFVQTTRILREAVSNIIKHSGASHCKVRCALQGTQFGLNIQDNGTRHPDGARRQARPRPRHVQHEAPRQADAGAVPGRVRARAMAP